MNAKIYRDRNFKVRCSAGELEVLKNKAEAAGLGLSQFVRDSVAQKQIISREDVSVRRAAIREISKCGNNLNQIARKLNTESIADLSMLATIENHLSKLRELLS